MTEDEVEEMLSVSPTLYHMAERGAWPAIERFGLLSTSALLDLYGVDGRPREAIERRHRPASVPVAADGLPGAVVRDQLPMSDAGLVRALPPRIAPADWYALLNSRVFFWLSRERLLRLTTARTYRDAEHDVLEVDARSLLSVHARAVTLCPINSGCTKPVPHPRDERTFLRIPDYPYAQWRAKRRLASEGVVELAVDRSVPDVAAHVRRVVVMKGDRELEVLLDRKGG